MELITANEAFDMTSVARLQKDNILDSVNGLIRKAAEKGLNKVYYSEFPIEVQNISAYALLYWLIDELKRAGYSFGKDSSNYFYWTKTININEHANR